MKDRGTLINSVLLPLVLLSCAALAPPLASQQRYHLGLECGRVMDPEPQHRDRLGRAEEMLADFDQDEDLLDLYTATTAGAYDPSPA